MKTRISERKNVRNLIAVYINYHFFTFLQRVFKTRIADVEDLKQRIIDAFASITPELLERVRRDVMRRTLKCAERYGGHVEQLK